MKAPSICLQDWFILLSFSILSSLEISFLCLFFSIFLFLDPLVSLTLLIVSFVTWNCSPSFDSPEWSLRLPREVHIKLFFLDPITAWIWSRPIRWTSWILVFIPPIFYITLCWKCIWRSGSERAAHFVPDWCHLCLPVLVLFKLLLHPFCDI